MAVMSKVIEVNAENAEAAEAALNAALTAEPIPAAQYLEALTIAYSETNQKAMIVIFYDDGS